MSDSSPAASQSVLKSAAAMSVATLLSRMMGLVREQVFAFFFGAGNLTDAYNVAFRIPNLLRDLFAEGAMSASLVPVFTQTRVQKGDRRAWRVAGLVFRVLFGTVCLLTLVGMVFAPELVGLYASAFKQIPGKFELTVRMTRVMFPFFPLVALAAAFMGILNACGVFFLPAFASACFNFASIVVGVSCAQWIAFGGGRWGFLPIEGMAIGVLAGGLVQAFCQLPSLYRVGYRWEKKGLLYPAWHRDPRLRKMLWMMIPGTIGLAATQVNLLVNTVLATSQGPGAVSWLNYAFRLMQFPIGIFGVSLAAATLPKISYQWAQRDIQAVSETLSRSLRSVFAINLPASAGLAFLGIPIIELIFQYGRFFPEDTRSTAFALAMYSIGLTAYSAVKVLVPVCYALGNTRLPVVSSVLSVAITIILNLIMIGPCGYWGLALGTSIAAIFNALFLAYVVRRMIHEQSGAFSLKSLGRAFFVYLVLALTMGGLCYITDKFLNNLIDYDGVLLHLGRVGLLLARLGKMMVLLAEGLGFVMMTARLFHLEEVTEVMHLFMGKFRNKLRRKPT